MAFKMKRLLDKLPDDSDQDRAKRVKNDAPIGPIRSALGPIRMRTGFNLATGCDFENLLQFEDFDTRSEDPNVPRLIETNLVNSEIIRRPESVLDIDSYLNHARSLTDVPSKVEELPHIVEAGLDHDSLVLGVRLTTLDCETEDDFLALEEHVRFE